MKILPVKLHNTAFSGRREDRNTTSQLTKNNDYSLTDNNQKKIEKAIENLGSEKGENNIKFLLNTAENLKYGTNIANNAQPKHNWKEKLKIAAQNSLAVSDPILKEKYSGEIKRIFHSQKPLTDDENAILESKSFILKNINKSELSDEKNENIKNIEKNLDYFIISSEIPIKQKKYILNRFEFFLSPDFQINPQLENKKTLILAEILNDIVVNSGSRIPNTKSINQKNHGMCAAISIARKLMSYEYKKDYVDTILSELENTQTMMVYDIANIGSGEKIPVSKTDVNFIDAMNKGYRIIDASTTQWMNIADMTGVNNKESRIYLGFDPEYFGTFQDAHYLAPFADEKLQSKQSYYQALITAKDKIDTAKAAKLTKDLEKKERTALQNADLKTVQELNKSLLNEIKSAIPTLSQSEVSELKNKLLSLEVKTSSQIDKIKDDTKKYHFIPNEEDIIKNQKLENFIIEKYPQKTDKTLLKPHIGNIKDLIEMTKSITERLKPASNPAQKIRNDRKLFDAAAAYRTSMIFGLYDHDLRTDFMIHYNIPDSETILAENIKNTADYIKNTSDERFIEHFSKTFNIEPDKKAVLSLLSALECTVKYSLTTQMDKFYSSIGLTSRFADLQEQITYIKEANKQKDKQELNNTAKLLKIKPNREKVLEKLEKFEEILSNNPSEKDYIEIFNKIGNKSQLQVLADSFNTIEELIEKANDNTDSKIVKNLTKTLNLPENSTIEDVKKAFYQTVQNFNQMSTNISMIRDKMTIKDENGKFLNTANPIILTTRAMEKDGKILKESELIPLYMRYNAIDKLRSQDEFASRQGKISDPTLYKYTEQEKETIRKIKKSLNSMAADTNKELFSIFKEIKPPLEEAAKQDGIDSGSYWARKEAESGLYSSQQAKILQQLTGKPYKITEDVEKGVEFIKNMPHSGISGSNVFHDKPGGHAMYIAEIASHNGKDIIYHDNSWGASEHENIWIDSEGLTRTDYSDNRGGKLGYITNNEWRNGNYLSNVLNQSGKFQPVRSNSKQINKLRKEEEFEFPMIRDLIIPGVPAKDANDIASSIKDTIFIPDSIFIDDFENLAQNMTLEQIKSAKTANDSVFKLYQSEMKQINDRLEVTPFNNGVTSKQAYNMLADNDILKLTFEKAAFLKSYEEFETKWKELAKIKSVKELETIKNESKKIVRENFEYAFAKNPKILYAYALNKNKNHITTILNDAIEQNGIIATEKQLSNIIYNAANYEKDEIKLFDGSLKNTINFTVNKVLKQFDQNIPPSAQASKAKEQIKANLTKDLENALYFNIHDLEKDSDLQISIKKYIDKKYNPETDEEFVKIYQKLQNMTTDEFRKETADADYADMALKNVSGYDILQKYNAMHQPTRTMFSNILYQKHLIDAIKLSDTETSYKYKKLQKKASGVKYKNDRTYDDLYQKFNASLKTLTYKKMFNQNKAEAYRKYGAFPAYPYIDILDNTMLKLKLEEIDNSIKKHVNHIKNAKINLFNYEQTEKADKFLNLIPDNNKLSLNQRKILNKIAGKFINANYNDKTIARSLNSAEKILEMPQNAPAIDFKKAFEQWKTEIIAIKKLNPTEEIKNTIKAESTVLKESLNIIVNTDLPQRHRETIKNALNDWVREEIKCADNFYDKSQDKQIIEQKISQNSTNDLSERQKSDFLEKLDLLIQKLKKTAIAERYNEISKNMHYVNMLNDSLGLANEFLDAENQQIFSEKITEISQKSEKLSKEEVAKAVRDALIPLSHEKNIEKSKNFNSLVKNLYKLKREIAATQQFGARKQNLSDEIDQNLRNFLDKFIKNDAKEALRIKICEYIKKEAAISEKSKNNHDKTDEFRRIFEEKYQKYHILNFPTEILDRFTELSAKNSEITKTSSELVKYRLITEQKQLKRYLDTALSITTLIDIQEQLMEAENLGNASFVASKFKNYDLQYLINPKTGLPATMADDEAVDYMVRALVLKNNNNTARLFVEKLGLTEKFLKIEEEMLDVEAFKQNIRKIRNILKVTDLQNDAIMAEMNKFDEEFDAAEDYEERIEKAKQNIKDKTAKLTRKKNIKLVLEALDEAKNLIKENPNIQKSLIVDETVNSVLSVITQTTNNDLHKLQIEMQNLSIICDLIESMNIPEYSSAKKYKEEIEKKYAQILEYNKKLLTETVKTSSIINLTDDI